MRSTSEGLLVSIFEGFWSIFGPNLGGKIHQKSMSKRILKMTTVKERQKNKILQKSMPRDLLMLTSFFDRFFIVFCPNFNFQSVQT